MFLEPEGLGTNEYYVQGMSSSLPEEVQIALYRTVPGMEHVRFTRTAYAIEYDCVDPLQLKLNLEYKQIAGLFLAGQINGSSGYEEAAAQGILAGINAVQFLRQKEPLILGRDEAYAGVLVDDLATKGTREPYRMMTSRAEYRLLLRQDNADARLVQKGREVGLVSDQRYDAFMRKQEAIARFTDKLNQASATPAQILQKTGLQMNRTMKLAELMRRPEAEAEQVFALLGERPSEDVAECIRIALKYEGYIGKQRAQVERFRSLENRRLPADFDYSAISGLRLEARAKLAEARPENLGQAARISGVSPADITVLLVELKARGL